MWDRWVTLAAAVLIAARAAQWGWKLGRGGDWLAGSGGMLLAVVSIAVPLVLVMLGPAGGR